MKEKSKGFFGKLIDINDKSNAGINISFVSHQDVQLDIIKKDNELSDFKNEDNKELASLLSDIESGFKQTGISLKINQGKGEKKKIASPDRIPEKHHYQMLRSYCRKCSYRHRNWALNWY